MPHFLKFLRIIVCVAITLISGLLHAQQTEENFPEVNEIRVEFDGFKAASEQFVLSNIQLRPGMNYNPALVDQSIRTLYGSNFFEFVEVNVENAGNGMVDVVFGVISKYKISNIVYNGNDSYSNKRLASKSELETNISLDEYQISLAKDKIREYYVKKGFPDAQVDFRIDRDAETGNASVYFDIEEGKRIKIRKIAFEGNTTFQSKQLRKVLETRRRTWLSWLTGTGRFDEAIFQEDLDLLRTFYRNQGFLDVVVREDLVDIAIDSKNRMTITIKLEEGERYFLGEMSIKNATIFTTNELLSQVKVQSETPFSPEKIDEAADAIRSYYTSRGYLNAFTRAERVPNMDNRRIDVVFRVRESEKFYVESIKVEGNTKTKARVIIRELALTPGDVFDMKRMETSKSRLDNTRFFEDVRLNPETTNLPGRKDLGVTVREGRTGNFTFGAGFGSVESAVVYFEMTQGNFDIFNWRHGFQGDGQKFRFRASLGTTSNEIVVTFEEPWLFEQRLAFGVELFRRESDFNSSDYNELRTGFEIYLRRRLFELVEGRLSYRLELVDIFDVDRASGTTGAVPNDGVPDVFQEAEGEELVSKVGLTLLRDNRDSLLFTRKGNRTSLTAEVAGLGGDVEYLKLEARTAHYIPTFDTLRQSISFIGRVGSIAPFGGSEIVPFYDRFYLGGPDSLRGYDFRDIGPVDDDDSNESVGGNTYAFFSAEYSFRVAEPLALVVFYDWGFVNEDEYDFNPTESGNNPGYGDNWGIGARVLLMGSPLKLDLGIPITDPTGNADGAQFNFSFGTRF